MNPKALHVLFPSKKFEPASVNIFISSVEEIADHLNTFIDDIRFLSLPIDRYLW